MRCMSLVLVLGLGSVAVAQPGPPPTPPPPDTTTTTTTTTEPTPTPTPAPVAKPAPVVTEEPAEDTNRPEGFSVALGVGYGLPTSLEMPNVTSARLRLASGLTLEPRLQFSNESAKTTPPPPADSTSDKETVFRIDVLGRIPVITHNKVDLEVLAGAGFLTDKLNPDGDFNTKTTTTFGIAWGLGIGYWISRHWQFSMSVVNPLIEYSIAKTQVGPDMSNKTTDTAVGLIFEPDVVMMIHLYN
jgi:outer membrane biosynthesis protein TonB